MLLSKLTDSRAETQLEIVYEGLIRLLALGSNLEETDYSSGVYHCLDPDSNIPGTKVSLNALLSRHIMLERTA